MDIAGPEAVSAKACYSLSGGLNTPCYVESVTINCERCISTEEDQSFATPKYTFWDIDF